MFRVLEIRVGSDGDLTPEMSPLRRKMPPPGAFFPFSVKYHTTPAIDSRMPAGESFPDGQVDSAQHASSRARSARTDGQESRRGAFAIPDDAHQFLVGHLFHTRSPVIQFGNLIRLHITVDQLADLGRLAQSEVTI